MLLLCKISEGACCLSLSTLKESIPENLTLQKICIKIYFELSKEKAREQVMKPYPKTRHSKKECFSFWVIFFALCYNYIILTTYIFKGLIIINKKTRLFISAIISLLSIIIPSVGIAFPMGFNTDNIRGYPFSFVAFYNIDQTREIVSLFKLENWLSSGTNLLNFSVNTAFFYILILLIGYLFSKIREKQAMNR